VKVGRKKDRIMNAGYEGRKDAKEGRTEGRQVGR
jgi:hypothetical protein